MGDIALAFGLLAAVYVPAFASVSILSARQRFHRGRPGVLMGLVIGVSAGVTLLLMGIIGHGGYSRFGLVWPTSEALLLGLGLGLGYGAAWSLLGAFLGTRVPFAEGLSRWELVLLGWFGAPIQEELIFRGLFQEILERATLGAVHPGGLSLSLAALIGALVFAALHIAIVSGGASLRTVVFVMIGAFILGLIAGQLRWLTGSIVPGTIVHALCNISGTLVDWIGSGPSGG